MQIVDEATFDRLFAESAGVYLWTYLQVRLVGEPARAPAVLEEAYARLLAAGALIHDGEQRAFRTRLYGLIDRAIPHLAQPGLVCAGAESLSPELRARARAFRAEVEAQWHALHAEHLAALLALPEREREAILLRDFHCWSMHELGREFGMAREEARAWVDRVRRRLRGEHEGLPRPGVSPSLPEGTS